MIRSILADRINDDILSLETMLSENFPNIQICGKSNTLSSTKTLIDENNPEIVFINIELPRNNGFKLNDYFSKANYEVILLTDSDNYDVDASNSCVCGYLTKPFQKKQFNSVVKKAILKISQHKENTRNKIIAKKYFKQSANEDVIGVPTIEGFEFISINEIVRCEGLQKCTRVITKERTDIVSSYNLGKFRKLLEPYGFYSPHKSHLVNLKHIRKYHREGNILMTNNSYVPVAKRKKKDFLDQVKRI